MANAYDTINFVFKVDKPSGVSSLPVNSAFNQEFVDKIVESFQLGKDDYQVIGIGKPLFRMEINKSIRIFANSKAVNVMAKGTLEKIDRDLVEQISKLLASILGEYSIETIGFGFVELFLEKHLPDIFHKFSPSINTHLVPIECKYIAGQLDEFVHTFSFDLMNQETLKILSTFEKEISNLVEDTKEAFENLNDFNAMHKSILSEIFGNAG